MGYISGAHVASWEAPMLTAADDGNAEDSGAEEPLGGEVIAVLVDNHRTFLSFLEKRVGRRDLAEDLLQEAFARGLKNRPTLGSEESSIAWFYRVLRNAVIDHHRRGGANERVLSRLASELEEHVEPMLVSAAARSSRTETNRGYPRCPDETWADYLPPLPC